MSKDKKTSEQWAKLASVEILDPDGWNRTNFQYSFHEELITEEEFNKRLMLSTCIRKPLNHGKK